MLWKNHDSSTEPKENHRLLHRMKTLRTYGHVNAMNQRGAFTTIDANSISHIPSASPLCMPPACPSPA
jgi:hypothetical protein